MIHADNLTNRIHVGERIGRAILVGVALVLLIPVNPVVGAAQTEYHFPPRVLEHLPEWAPGSEVLASVGREDGDPEHLIGQLIFTALLADGGLSVTDYLQDRVRVYGADGSHRLDLSGRGEGPGEFVDLGARVSSTRSGGFLAWGQRRAFTFSPQGELETEYYYRGELGAPPEFLGLSANERFLITGHSLDRARLTPGQIRIDSLIVGELDPETGEVTEWLRLPNPAYYASGLQTHRVRAVLPGPGVLPRAIVAMSPDGMLIRGRSDRWEFEWWTPEGGVAHRVTFDFPEHVIDDMHRDRMVSTLAGTRNLGARDSRTPEQARLERAAQELFDGIERGEAVAGFQVYSGGEIVVGASRHPGGRPEPLLLSDRGRPLGWLVNDPDEHGRYPRVMDIWGDRVLLRVQDPDTDVVHLEIRPFLPREPAPRTER